METSPQSKSLFNYYNFYKVIIGILLYGIAITQQNLVQQFRLPLLFEYLTFCYLVTNTLLLLIFRFSSSSSPRRIFITIALDIAFLHALFYCGSGISGGLANLIIISVAAGNIIIRGKIGLSFAALATLFTLLIEGERYFIGYNDISDIARTGLIGSMYFASAYILQYLSIRISQNEQLLKAQQRDLRALEKLNHQIIQSMRTGIIVCNEQEIIRMSNNACIDLIGLDKQTQLPGFISERIRLWKLKPEVRTTPFKASPDKPLVQANFAQLQKETGTDTLIFLEDTRKMTQQAQQLKLASLGRLTASIAHEVRNPLGAISHATQLLAESENLDNADKKMTDIIQRHSKRVNQIIENTLSLSRRTEPQVAEVNLSEWLDKVISDYNLPDGKPAKVELIKTSPNAHARFDSDQIEQVLTNLIDNALRHGEKAFPESTVFVVLSETSDGSQAFVDVIDQGAGVNDENALHLFEPFFTTEAQGTGLGLYLSREICEANQAHLDFIETEGINVKDLPFGHDKIGACFRIMFAHYRKII